MKALNLFAQTGRLLAILLIVLSSPSFAEPGGINGGGGKGIVCPGPDGKPQVELLDIWEARELHAKKWKMGGLDPAQALTVKELEFVSSKEHRLLSTMDIVAYGTEALAQAFPWEEAYWGGFSSTQALSGFTNTILSRGYITVDRKRGVELMDSHDSFERARPRNCPDGSLAKIEQIVNFDLNGGMTLIDDDLVDGMSPLNEAALALHESVYPNLHLISGEQNSIRARRAVGYALSGGKFVSTKSLLRGEYVACKDRATKGKATAIYFVPSKEGDSFFPVVDRIIKMPILGHAPTMWIGYKDTNAVFRDFRKKTGKYPLMLHSINSPVDFDTRVALTIRGNIKARNGFDAEAELLYSASGLSGKSGPLDCAVESVK